MIDLDTKIAGLSAESKEDELRSVLRALADAKLDELTHANKADAIRRLVRMNRSTFKRLHKRAMSRARA
jgi:hypothetical protein